MGLVWSAAYLHKKTNKQEDSAIYILGFIGNQRVAVHFTSWCSNKCRPIQPTANVFFGAKI